MRYIIAKIGTHPSQRILLLKGAPREGCWVEWSETGRRRGRRETGIVDRVNDDGLVFISRM